MQHRRFATGSWLDCRRRSGRLNGGNGCGGGGCDGSGRGSHYRRSSRPGFNRPGFNRCCFNRRCFNRRRFGRSGFNRLGCNWRHRYWRQRGPDHRRRHRPGGNSQRRLGLGQRPGRLCRLWHWWRGRYNIFNRSLLHRKRRWRQFGDRRWRRFRNRLGQFGRGCRHSNRRRRRRNGCRRRRCYGRRYSYRRRQCGELHLDRRLRPGRRRWCCMMQGKLQRRRQHQSMQGQGTGQRAADAAACPADILRTRSKKPAPRRRRYPAKGQGAVRGREKVPRLWWEKHPRGTPVHIILPSDGIMAVTKSWSR